MEWILIMLLNLPVDNAELVDRRFSTHESCVRAGDQILRGGLMAASYKKSPIIKMRAPARVQLAVFRQEAKCVGVPAYDPPPRLLPLPYKLPCQSCKPVSPEPTMGTFFGEISQPFPAASPNAVEKIKGPKNPPSQLGGLQPSQFFLPPDRKVISTHSTVD